MITWIFFFLFTHWDIILNLSYRKIWPWWKFSQIESILFDLSFFFFLHIYLHVVIWGQEFSHAPCGESLMAIWVSRFCIMGHKVKFWASWGLCVIRIQRCVFFLFVCSGRLQTLKWSFGRGFGGFIKRTSGLNMSYFLFLFFSPMVNFHVNCFLYV